MKRKKYISYDQSIIALLAEYGFRKKNKDFFIRDISLDVSQEISFGHSTQGQAHAKYYAIRIAILLPKVLELAQKQIIFLPLTAFYTCNIGELMPKRQYLEWFVSEDTDEKYDKKVVESMLFHIKKYAIPFLDKYSTPMTIVNGIKSRAYPNRYGDNYQACIALFLYGEKEDFEWFVEQRSYEIQFNEYETEGHWDYKHTKEPIKRGCREFLECANKLSLLLKEK